jgi:DNA-binding LacI/PurR family transcriptional regulator
MVAVNHRVRVTIRDVAEKAGVSAQTVSRVVNGHPDVAANTRARVEQIITELRYRPNAIARSLVGKSSGTLGVVASGFEHFGPSQLLAGIEQQATDLGWHMMLQIADRKKPDDYDRIASNLISQGVDGVIWAYPELTGDRERSFHQQIKPHAPIIFLSMAPQPNSAVIGLDNRLGARMAVEHLIERGFRHIGIITGPLALWSSHQRRLGWQDALQGARLPHAMKQIAEGDWSAASGDAGLTRLLGQFPQLDAVFASNDQMALGALRAAQRHGRTVPGSLGVTGFDDIPESAYFMPPLTTVHHDLRELGRLAVRELHRVIEAQRQGHEATATSLTLQPHLVVRESA